MPAKSLCPFEVEPILHPSGCRSYVVVEPESRDAAVVDPLLDRVGETLRILSARHGALRWIVDTHGHGDHLSGAAALRAKTGADVVMAEAAPSAVVTRSAKEGDVLALGESGLKVRLAPGNAPDAIVLEAPGVLFTGDTLLVGTVGRRDVPGWDVAAHYETLQRIFDPLPETTVIHPGHDDMGRSRTTLKAERRGNKWLREKDRETFVARLTADPRPTAVDAEEILAANRTGSVDPPPEAVAAAEKSGVASPVASEGVGAARTGGLVPEGLAQVFVLGGLLCIVGAFLAILVHPLFAALPGVVGAAAVGVGLSGARRRAGKKGEPGLYYTGPVRRTPTR